MVDVAFGGACLICSYFRQPRAGEAARSTAATAEVGYRQLRPICGPSPARPGVKWCSMPRSSRARYHRRQTTP